MDNMTDVEVLKSILVTGKLDNDTASEIQDTLWALESGTKEKLEPLERLAAEFTMFGLGITQDFPVPSTIPDALKEVVTIDRMEYAELVNEVERLRKQVDDLQANQTKLVEENRKNDLSWQVAEFHRKFGFPVRTRPQVPSEYEVRFRMRLLAEEFMETIRATYSFNPLGDLGVWYNEIEIGLAKIIDDAPIKVKLLSFADGLADMNYIIAGTAATFGLPMKEIHREVQRANMDKDAVIDPFEAENSTRLGRPNWAKPSKPVGWKEPDIAHILLEHGWEP